MGPMAGIGTVRFLPSPRLRRISWGPDRRREGSSDGGWRHWSVALLIGLHLSALPAAENGSYSTVWIGNSGTTPEQLVQHQLADLFVTADGTLFTNAPWDDAGRGVSVYRNGLRVAGAPTQPELGYFGGRAVAVNSRYLYFGQRIENVRGGTSYPDTWPPEGSVWFGVARRLREAPERPAPFSSGKGGAGGTPPQSFLLVVQLPAALAEQRRPAISGLWANEKRLYVSSPFDGRVRVYDAETMQPLFSWPLQRPGPIVQTPDGTLWIVQEANQEEPPRVLSYDADGFPKPQRIVLPPESLPSDLAIDVQGRLYVADRGPSQQIHVYDVSGRSPRLVESLGAPGGLLAPPAGRVGPWRFYNPQGIGLDAAGNLYVASGGTTTSTGTILEAYSPNRELLWRRMGLHATDCADLDPRSETDVFTKEEHLQVKWDSSAGLTWTLQGLTVDRFRFPEDPRLHLWSAGAQVHWIAGRRFLFVSTPHMETLVQLYRFVDQEEVLRPSVVVARRIERDDWPPHQPVRGPWIWRDADGDGRFDAPEYAVADQELAPVWAVQIDARGDLWIAEERGPLWRLSLQGLDTVGNPIWSFQNADAYPLPKPFNDVRRLYYDPAEDLVILGGWTPDQPFDGHGSALGKVIVCYDSWSRPERSIRWRTLVPWNSETTPPVRIQSMSVAGDYVFLGEAERGGLVHVYDKRTGEHVQDLRPPESVGTVSPVESPYGYRAVQRANGEYIIFVEDAQNARVLLYRWRP